MKNLVVLFVALCCANSSAGASIDGCHFQEIASSYRSEYVWFQILENLEGSLGSESWTASQLKVDLAKAMEATLKSCGQPNEIYYDLKSLKNIKVQGAQVSFTLFGKDHFLEIQNSEDNKAFIYRRPNQKGYNTVYFQLNRKPSGDILNIRALGHSATAESSYVHYFYYDAQRKFLGSSANIPVLATSGEIKSLRSIYGHNFEAHLETAPKVRVGVIGTGIDYNHPKIAKHLLTRLDFENQLQDLEEQEFQVADQSYLDKSLLDSQILATGGLREQIGFPEWMDQALKSPRPFDKLIPSMPNRSSQHETAMAGRILKNGGSIGLYSVRKAYGYIAKENITEIFENFQKVGVQVVNLSYSYPCEKDDPFESQWRKAFEDNPDIFVVAAAGNDGQNTAVTAYCPARYSQDYKNVISVTAIDSAFQLATYNDVSVNFGPGVDFAARADSLQTYSPFGKDLIVKENGASSMATAEVSRILVEALLKGLNFTSETLKPILAKTSIKTTALSEKVRAGGYVNQELFEAELLKNIYN